MTQSLDEIYTAEWFAHDFAELQPEFNIVADAIYRQFRPEWARDIGCGPGMVVRRLREVGVDAMGLDGSKHALAAAVEDVRGYLAVADITTCPSFEPDPSKRRLIICTEVAEHLDAEHAPGLVKLLCSAVCPIVFTAAPPGQDGHHHVNCQDGYYWVKLFQAHGVVFEHAATCELQARWAGLRRLSHMTKNVMVFT